MLGLFVERDWPDSEGVLSRRNHGQRDGSAVCAGVVVLGLQPCTETRVVNLGLVLPKVRPQPTLYLEMIQMQLDNRDIPREIPPDIRCADVQSRHSTAAALCFHYHICLLFNVR